MWYIAHYHKQVCIFGFLVDLSVERPYGQMAAYRSSIYPWLIILQLANHDRLFNVFCYSAIIEIFNTKDEFIMLCLRACAQQKKFGEKMAGEIESEKGHTCIPVKVRTQKARLASVTSGSKAEQIVSRSGPTVSMIPAAIKGCCTHLPVVNVYNAPLLMSDTVMSIEKHSQLSMKILDSIKVKAITIIIYMTICCRKLNLKYMFRKITW